MCGFIPCETVDMSVRLRCKSTTGVLFVTFYRSTVHGGANLKHADDYFFIEGARRHPMRTHNISNARLFVVTVPLSTLVMQTLYKSPIQVCWKGMCGSELLEYTDAFLAKSAAFQAQQGNDHILDNGTWGWKLIGGHKRYRNLMQCHWIGFGEAPKTNARNRQYFYKTYVGTKCEDAPKSNDLAMVASQKPNDKRFQSRRDICNWLSADQFDWSVCGKGQQCPALAQSKFGFHVRGDSFGANRLFDTLLSGTVPIFTQREQYGIHPDWFDWDQVSYFADVTNEASFMASIENIVADKKGYEERHRNVLANRVLFDWTTSIPFDMYMYQLQAHLRKWQVVNTTC